MSKLPQRDDHIYEMIRNIKTYEMTRSCRFLLAIRNPEAIKLLNNAMNCIVGSSEEKQILEELLQKFGMNSECVNRYIDTYSPEAIALGNGVEVIDEEDIFQYDEDGDLVSPLGGLVKFPQRNLSYRIIELAKKYYKKKNRYYEGNKTNFDFIPSLIESIIQEKNLDEYFQDDYIINDNGDKIILNKFTNIKLLDKSFIDTLDKGEIFIDIESLELSYLTPELSLPNDKRLSLNINKNLPNDEIKAIWEEVIKEINKHTHIVQSFSELLGESETDTPKEKLTNNRIADKFFVYDYVTVRWNDIEEMRAEDQVKFESELEEIQRRNLSIKIKRELTEELQTTYHQEDIIDTKIKDIFEEIKENTYSELPVGTISRYYYTIKPFIDDLGYKNL